MRGPGDRKRLSGLGATRADDGWGVGESDERAPVPSPLTCRTNVTCSTGVGVERLWTEKSARLEVRVLNVPFYVRGISFGDVVRIRPDHERREFRLRGADL
ncbi:DUF4265 domain-containing protein [Oerskovia sp. NPDC060338]|uniref:DUF4265 domain-containing protein n=1 Tax=Oerskovia sp. NPDC060338 TaxID=3347100 RepID=UPI00364ACC9A